MSAALKSITPIVRKETLATIVREELRSALMAGRFQPGEKLTIRAVASALDVSLTPAREALYNLMSEGVLDSGPNGTVFVPVLNQTRLRELTKIRISLEGMAACEAMAHLTPRQINKLTALNTKLSEAELRLDYSSMIQMNWKFHFDIYEAAQMPTLFRMIEGCWLKMGSYLNLIYPAYGETGEGLQNHQRIIEALQNKDAEALSQTIRKDIEQSCDWVVQMVEAG